MAWVSPEILERWEERSNRAADRVMDQGNKSWVMRWAVVAPTVLMDTKYVLCYLGVTFGAMLCLQIGAQILILPLIWSGQIDLARMTHAPAPTVSVVLAAELLAIRHNTLMISFIVVGFLVWNIISVFPRAYFWNRRARRLLAIPPLDQAIPDPSVWPPPPRITG